MQFYGTSDVSKPRVELARSETISRSALSIFPGVNRTRCHFHDVNTRVARLLILS